MIKNYLKFAWRNLQKHKGVNLINLFGLAIGISVALIIFLIVRYDRQFDRWEPGNRNIYRVYSYAGADDINSGVTTALPEAIREKVHGVKDISHVLYSMGSVDLTLNPDAGHGRLFTNVKNVVYADRAYFSIFPRPWLAGNEQEGLKQPGQVVLTRKLAQVYFPEKPWSEVVGQSILIGDSTLAKISGVVEDLEHSTDFDNQVFISLATITNSARSKELYGWDQWGHISYSSVCFVRLEPGVTVGAVEEQLKKVTLDNDKPQPGIVSTIPKLLPLAENHFAVDIDGVIRKSTLLNLGLIGVFILALAIVNYINISTAQSSLRLKEIAIRKTFGSNKRQIRFQMLMETFLITLIGGVLGILLMPLFMRAFAGFIPPAFHLWKLFDRGSILGFFVIIIFITIAAGYYPALVLAKYNPTSVIRKSRTGLGRKILIVSQFVIAQVLVMLVLTVNRQIHYSLSSDLGYKNTQGIISFYVPDATKFKESKKNLLMERLKRLQGIAAMTLSSAPPTSSSQSISTLTATVGNKPLHLSVWVLTGDTSYVGTFGIPLLAGNNLRQVSSDSVQNEVLVNETLARTLGYADPKSAINKMLDFDGDKVIIKGVMGDFNTGSTKTALHPVLFYNDFMSAGRISLRLEGRPDQWQGIIESVKGAFHEVYPDHNFDYSFLDKFIEKLYEQDIAIGKVLTWSSGLAIFISCLGLFGLISFIANQRKKEIGIRKVLGAPVAEIIKLLSKNMLGLVCCAVIIALPLGWSLSSIWLNGFAYKTSLSLWFFLSGGAGLLFLALFVLSTRAWVAAKANPIDSIQSE